MAPKTRETFGAAKQRTRLSTVLAPLRNRALPIIQEDASVEEVVRAMIRFEHSRLLYVVDDGGRLTGAISLGALVRHVFSQSHTPRIHGRHLMNMVTAETAKDIMQKKPISAKADEEVSRVLSRMIAANVKEIAVVDDEKKLVGDLTVVDLLRFLADEESAA